MTSGGSRAPLVSTDLAAEMRRLSGLLDKGLTALVGKASELAQAEHDYRLDVAKAWSQAPEGTVPEREAWVNAATAPLRRQRDEAEHLNRAALEAVRSRRTQISALQSLMNAHREEAAFARTGPEAA